MFKLLFVNFVSTYRERYQFTNIAFVIQMCQPQNKRPFISTANEALVGALMTIGDVNDIFSLPQTDEKL